MNPLNSAPSSAAPLRSTSTSGVACCQLSVPAVIGWALIASSIVPFLLATRRERRERREERTPLIVGASLVVAGGALLAARRLSAQR